MNNVTTIPTKLMSDTTAEAMMLYLSLEERFAREIVEARRLVEQHRVLTPILGVAMFDGVDSEPDE